MSEATPGLVEMRRRLHRGAELSDQEEGTAALIRVFLAEQRPDRLAGGLGGHGVAARFDGREPGPTVLVRCELDALPIPEGSALAHATAQAAVSHKCGHDGHMAIVAGLAPLLRASPPERGAVVLLFQPAEETGQGARRVLEDPGFAPFRPDYAFALHNLPGFELGQVVLREGVFASASKGLHVALHGSSSHAAEPQHGRSPALAVAQLVEALSALPQLHVALEQAAKVTLVHARIGELAFGTSPGEAVVAATLRAHSQEVMDALSARCVELVQGLAGAYGLRHELEWREQFPSTANDPDCVARVEAAARGLGLEVFRPAFPFPWSEDFGHFTARHRGALFGLGAGRDQPALHHPSYDFPDALVGIGLKVFETVVRQLVGGATREES